MRTEAEIRAKIKEVVEDERFHYKTATVVENAPLALIQLGMETRVQWLAWVLGEKPPQPQRKGKRS